MAKVPASEVFSTLKGYFHQLSEGEKTPTEVANAFNEWAREGAESVKAKIAEEVEATVSKMGFIKRDEYVKLLARVDALEKKSSPKKAPVKKAPVKKAPVKKAPVKKTMKKVAKKASK